MAASLKLLRAVLFLAGLGCLASCSGSSNSNCASVVCQALDSCHDAGVCVAATGACTNPAKADGTPCDDGNPCTGSDRCAAGVCVGESAVTCSPSDACHVAGTCSPQTGACTSPTQTDGTPCGNGFVCSSGLCVVSGGSVLQHHNGELRLGVYVDPTLTKASASTFHVDPTFQAAVTGSVYAQLLYFVGGPGGKDVVVVATEGNDVEALDAATGAAVWSRNLGAPVPLADLPCGDIDPLGVTGTPIIDPAARRIYLDAMTTPDGGTTKRHLVFALSLDDGSTIPGWPVDVSASLSFDGTAFDSSVQNQRGALALAGGTLYVPYGGLAGDCGTYHGWLAGFPAADPSVPGAWATGAAGGGSWAPSGVASDGAALFISTGNTFGASTWQGGEALLRFSAGPVFSGLAADYFAPSDWMALDASDADLGGTGPLLVTVEGATPSGLVLGLGKDGNLYLVDRAGFGGIGGALAAVPVSSSGIINAAASYTTALGTYVVFKGNGVACPAGESGDLTAVRLTPTSPPGAVTAWCAAQNGLGSPMVTTTDGSSEAIVWSLGAEGDERLHGFDGDTGAVVYAGGGSGDVLGTVRRYHTPILAKGRIFVGVDGAVRALVR